MPLYRKRPVEVEAIRLAGKLDPEAFAAFMGDAEVEFDEAAVYIHTREGVMRADVGDWIIREPFPTDDRTLYPCKHDIFEATYEALSPSVSAES